MVPIEIRSKSHPADAEVRRFAERRTQYALGRLRDLRRVVISIEDVNGPKGGPDKRCRVSAEFAFGSVAAEGTHTTWKGAVARAVHRLGTNAAQELQRINRSSLHRHAREAF